MVKEKENENNVIKLVRKDIASITKDNRKEVLEKIKGYFSTFSSDFFDKYFIFVYGTLRKGQENYTKLREIYGEKSIQYIYTTQWDHRCLYDLGAYPAIMGGTNLDSVIGDVLFVEAEVYNFIKQMEEEAGYEIEKTVLWISTETSAYYRCLRIPSYVAGKSLENQIRGDKVKYPKITCGDWIRYQRQTEAVKEDEVESEIERNNKIMRQWGDYSPYY